MSEYLANFPRLGQSNSFSPSHSLLQNLRNLLLFWQDHYLHKDKDCSALQKVSIGVAGIGAAMLMLRFNLVLSKVLQLECVMCQMNLYLVFWFCKTVSILLCGVY